MRFKNPNRKDWKITILVIIGVFLFTVTIGYLGPVQLMELKVRDWMFELRGEQELDHSDIVIIEMSQSADDEIPYKYPWPTYVYAKLIENLNKAGVRAIGIDVVFDQNDIYELKNDSLFAEAVEKHGNVILAGTLAREVRTMDAGIGVEQTRMVLPNNILRQANPNPIGLVNTVTDRDEFIRNYLLYLSGIDDVHYSLALEMLRFLSDDSEFEIERIENQFQFGPYSIPTYQANTMLINYYGGARSFDYIGFEEVIDDQDFETVTEREAFEMNLFDDPEYGILHRGILQDKIVFVGATMPELQDLHPIPMRNEYGNANMPGVEIHAHAMQNILDQNYLTLISGRVHLVLLFFISAIIVLIARSVNLWFGFAVMIVSLILWIAISVYLFTHLQVILFYLSPSMAILFGFGGVISLNYFYEERERRRITNMFSSYVSPKVVDRMIRSDEAFKLGGEDLEITALFSDIVNFSRMAEKIPPPVLIELMNDYLEEMTEIIMQEQGTLDKYIGDAVMAFYGAPAEIRDHAYRACTTAIRMQLALPKIRDRWLKIHRDLPQSAKNLSIRIGINTGRMIVGNIGSKKRFSYTILGDQVNVAARCEAACKKYGVSIVVTGRTAEKAAKDSIGRKPLLFRPLDIIRVKGRDEPVKILECLGFQDELSPEIIECTRLFRLGHHSFEKRKWDEAAGYFRESAKLEHARRKLGVNGYKINPSRLYLERCRLLKIRPPKPDWDGVFEQTAEY